MADSLSGPLPWPGQVDDDVDSSSAETTPGGAESTPWVVVAAHLMPAEAIIIKGRLESHGLAAVVQQEAMGQVLGLTIGPMGAANVLVPEPQAEEALAILAETFDIEEIDENEDEGE